MSSININGFSSRSTNAAVARNYTRNLGSAMTRMYDLQDRILTGARFRSMAENTGLGVRAMEIRRNLARIETQVTNADTAKSSMQAAEDVLTLIHDNCKSAMDKYRLAVNGSSGDADLDALKVELQEIQKEMLQNLNGQFGNKYLLGGSNSSVAPFRIDPDDAADPGRKLQYYDVGTGTYIDVDSINAGDAAVDDHIYIDVGLGMNFDSLGNLNTNSVFDKAVVGVAATGFGSAGNIYDLLTEMINSIPDDLDNDRLTGMEKASDKVLAQVTQLGANQNYLKYTVDRLGGEKLNLIERQQLIEGNDTEEDLIYFKMQTYVYEAALSMGANLLRPTLFDYIK